jgi:hypothetical protein
MSRRLLMPMILKYLRSLEHVVSSRLRLDTTHTLCFSSPEHKADDTRLCCFSLRYRRRKEESKVYLSTHVHRRKRCTYSVQQSELSNKQIKEKKTKQLNKIGWRQQTRSANFVNSVTHRQQKKGRKEQIQRRQMTLYFLATLYRPFI